ncbi:nuclear transport factor 2 family protein [Chlorobaculum sp. MV4-Y]|uniref:nuclear transport factor 2 family protein n=1 Tax=Chlorobaculum sp. MV4-Y TaxID=2976335 RepID=UPI0021AF3F8C|nr:nuclear transport factor 2 family protein [Chlorobaculum sp. MV4-Y]UWX58571.1 nuclear transport factor 2 family protein [Chlorobaculum sp. MV4-Y]
MDTRKLIEAYHLAWTSGDFATARNCLADDLDCRGSMDTFTKADDFIAALTQFRQMVQSVELLQYFYDKTGAALLYEIAIRPLPRGVIRTAEFFTVTGDRISAIRLVFNATALRQAMQA